MSPWMVVVATIGGLIVGIAVLFVAIQQIRGIPEGLFAYWELLTDLWEGRALRRTVMTADDWRLTGQERYLQGATLRWAKWWPYREGWDHDHCAFCFVHFSDHVLGDDTDTQLEGYVTEDDYHWICRPCFEDFKHRFEFSVSSN